LPYFQPLPNAVPSRRGALHERQVIEVAPKTVWCDAVAHGQHACGIVGSGPQRLRMLSGFVRSGLEVGDRVWCFPNGRRSEVLSWLRADNAADDDAVASGQLTVLPTHESALSALTTDPDKVIDGLRRAIDDALEAGWNGFRFIGDLGWATCGRSCPQRLMDFEVEVSAMLTGSPAAALCQYDRYRYDVKTMVALTEMHAAMVGTVVMLHGEELTISPLTGRPGLHLAGEVDLATREAFRVALDDVLCDPSTDLHLEMSDLEFIDVGGVQLILQTARRLKSGRRMVLHRPPRSFRLVFDLLYQVTDLVDHIDVVDVDVNAKPS